jgi:uncharacterized RDD family membrane protein YckC
METTTSPDAYVARVLDELPRSMPNRAQIGLELQAAIAERVANGQPLDDVLRQLGDPVALADSYLAEETLVLAPFMHRVAAKAIDVITMLVLVLPLAAFVSWLIPGPPVWTASAIFVTFCCTLFLAIYTVISEADLGQTVGKRALGLRVVRESGRRISFGQSVVRQLPLVLQVIWVDALFALFTERGQRAFELLSKTRVVLN